MFHETMGALFALDSVNRWKGQSERASHIRRGGRDGGTIRPQAYAGRCAFDGQYCDVKARA
jgi:hypothetical protein